METQPPPWLCVLEHIIYSLNTHFPSRMKNERTAFSNNDSCNNKDDYEIINIHWRPTPRPGSVETPVEMSPHNSPRCLIPWLIPWHRTDIQFRSLFNIWKILLLVKKLLRSIKYYVILTTDVMPVTTSKN